MTRQRLTRAERSAQTRAELMDSARRLFLRRGFHAASLELVAEEAGFTIGAVYSRFGSKADLFLAILDERIDQIVAEVAEVAGTDQPIPAHAELLAGRRMALLEREREWFPLVVEFWSHAARDERLRGEFAARHERLVGAYAGLIEADYARLGLPPAGPRGAGQGGGGDGQRRRPGAAGRPRPGARGAAVHHGHRLPAGCGRRRPGGGTEVLTMDVTYQTKRISDMAGAMRLARELIGHDHWSAEELAAWQRRRLDQVVRHATAASPFYRERYAGLDPGTPVQLRRLPVVDKATVMEHFDDLVTDPRLTLAAVEAHLDGLDRDELLLGRYRAMATGGSTGRKGVFVTDRDEWRQYLAGFFRWNHYVSLRPRLPRRLRIASIAAARPCT